MKIILFLLVFPLIPALLSSITGHRKLRGGIIRLSSAAIALGSIYCAWSFMGKDATFFSLDHVFIERGVLAGEVILALFLLYKCKDIVAKEWWIPALIVVQTAIMLFCDF